MNSNKVVIFISIFAAVLGISYWISLFSGIFPVEELVPGYRNWFMSFPIANRWMFICAILAVTYALRNHSLVAPFAPLQEQV